MSSCLNVHVFLFVVGESSGWSEYRTKDGYSYYHNFTTGESQWERPESYNGQSPQLSKDEIQVGGEGGRGGGEKRMRGRERRESEGEKERAFHLTFFHFITSPCTPTCRLLLPRLRLTTTGGP